MDFGTDLLFLRQRLYSLLSKTTSSRTIHPLHFTWAMMLNRCYNPLCSSYPDYGGRGIRVCARWHVFYNFIADLPPKPSPSHSLDRKDNNGNYEPSNCRWATKSQQALNRRPHFHQFIDQNGYHGLLRTLRNPPRKIPVLVQKALALLKENPLTPREKIRWTRRRRKRKNRGRG
jgi:hypothetical protein